MAKQHPADTVVNDGKVYPTVGENIRESSKNIVTAESISGAIKDYTDRSKVSSAMGVTSKQLKTAIISLLTSKSAYFGGASTDKLSAEQLAQIKEYLGIS